MCAPRGRVASGTVGPGTKQATGFCCIQARSCCLPRPCLNMGRGQVRLLLHLGAAELGMCSLSASLMSPKFPFSSPVCPAPRGWAASWPGSSSGPMCTESCGSVLQEQMRPKGFFWLSPVFLSPSTAPRLFFSWGFGNVFVLMARLESAWPLEMLPGSSPSRRCPRAVSAAPRPCHDHRGHVRDRDIQLLHLHVKERAGSCLGFAKAKLGVCPCALPAQGLLLLLSAPNGLLTSGGRSKADNCFPSLINRYKMSAQGARSQLIYCASDARCWLFTIPR